MDVLDKEWPCSVIINEKTDAQWEQMVDWCDQYVGVWGDAWTSDHDLIPGDSFSGFVWARYWRFRDQDTATRFQLVWG